MMQTFSAFDKRLAHILMVVFIFTIALFPRWGEGASRPNLWYERAYYFSEAVLERNWSETYQQYHPGVTFMWLAGTGMQQYMQQNGVLSQGQILLQKPTAAGVLNGLVDAALLPVIVTISMAITLTFIWLKALIGAKAAFAAALLLALDPLQLMYSKVVHIDGLLSVLMLLSAVALLRYVCGHGWAYLIASGVLAGLSLLTKTSAVFLIPYTMLIISWPLWRSLLGSWQTGRLKEWGQQAGKAIGTVGVWLVVVIVVMFVLFPALWVNPIDVLDEMFGNLLRHATNTHVNPIFFAGRLWYEDDPGLPFYAAIIAYKMTIVTLPGVIVGLVMGIRRRLEKEAFVLWALVAFAFFFYIQMSIGHFKQMAYILPALPALDVIAGIGMVWGLERAASFFAGSSRFVIATGLLVFLLLQAATILPAYPRFGTYHNPLLGGSKVARNLIPMQEEAEGVDLALAYIAGLPFTDEATIAVTLRPYLFAKRWYYGRYRTGDPTTTTFRIYDLNSLMRGQFDSVWLEQWRQDQNVEPLFRATYDGVTYAWVYGDIPDVPIGTGEDLSVDYQFGESIYLVDARANSKMVQAGSTLDVALYWTVADWIRWDYKVFVHVYGSDGLLVAQQDAFPLEGVRPTWSWGPGESLEDVIGVVLPAELKAGTYSVATGMYNVATLERLPVYAGDGRRVADDTAVLTSITIVEP